MNKLCLMLVPALVGTSLVLSGCKKAADKVSEKIIEKSLERSGASNAKVDVNKGKMSIKTDKGEMEFSTGDSVSLPADFPKDVYVVKGAKIRTAMKTPEGFMLQMQASESKAKIVEAYVAEMKDKGWKQEHSMDMDNMSSRMFKMDKRQAALVVSQNDKEAEVMLTLTTEK